MDSTGRLRDRAPNTQHQPSFYFPTFRILNDQGMVHDWNFQRDGAMMGRARRHPGETGGLAGSGAEKTVFSAVSRCRRGEVGREADEFRLDAGDGRHGSARLEG
jgi:hypothetical protein